MGHNPRRARRDPKDPDTLTDEQITDAMTRAVTLRRGRLLDPEIVRGQPLRADDAVAYTMRYRQQSWHYRMRSGTGRIDPWWWIGWVIVNENYLYGSWAVWLNVDDERVWLKLESRGRPSADDPYR